MEAKVYNDTGKEAGTIKLPENLFAVPWNADLVHQVTVAMAANRRRVTAAAKDRGAVAGGGRKPWRQKGTGRARHGSSRSPIWRGGGVTHGPLTEKRYDQKVNKKMRRRALATILSRKWRDGEVLFVKDLASTTGKTKEAAAVINRLAQLPGYAPLGWRRGRRALIATPTLSPALARGYRNLPAVALAETRNLNPLETLRYRFLVVVDPEKSLAALSSRL